jgi:hypothetical protein
MGGVSFFDIVNSGRWDRGYPEVISKTDDRFFNQPGLALLAIVRFASFAPVVTPFTSERRESYCSTRRTSLGRTVSC